MSERLDLTKPLELYSKATGNIVVADVAGARLAEGKLQILLSFNSGYVEFDVK